MTSLPASKRTPMFATFCALGVRFLTQTGRRTMCGMLVGARLSQVWSHNRAHASGSAESAELSTTTAVLGAGTDVALAGEYYTS